MDGGGIRAVAPHFLLGSGPILKIRVPPAVIVNHGFSKCIHKVPSLKPLVRFGLALGRFDKIIDIPGSDKHKSRCKVFILQAIFRFESIWSAVFQDQ